MVRIFQTKLVDSEDDVLQDLEEFKKEASKADILVVRKRMFFQCGEDELLEGVKVQRANSKRAISGKDFVTGLQKGGGCYLKSRDDVEGDTSS